ncbi:hypothetical protein HDU77_011471 [Chytriomyces hyalinus]|nr:hypothetical protein HDU77_011471 [Chytriomyces hyalinus]
MPPKQSRAGPSAQRQPPLQPQLTAAANPSNPPSEPGEVSRNPKHSWTAPQVSHLLYSLFVEAERGKRAGASFKPEAWIAARDKLNAKFGLQLDIMQVKSKINTLKIRLGICLHMRDQSGFGWNRTINAPTADDEKAYVAGLAKDKRAIARDIFASGLADFDMLCTLFEKNMAKGTLARGSNIPSTPATPTAATPTASTPSTVTPSTAAAITATPSTAQAGSSTTVPPTQCDTDDYVDNDDWYDPDTENLFPLQELPPPDALYLKYVASIPQVAATVPMASQGKVPPASSAIVPLESSPFVENTPIKRKSDANPPTGPVGERPKQSHTAPRAAEDVVLANSITEILQALKSPEAPKAPPLMLAPTAPLPLPDSFSHLPMEAQLSLTVAKKVNRILLLYNGELDGEKCEWLDVTLTYQYCELFENPHRAATFLGTLSDGASMQFLCYLYKSAIAPNSSPV